LFFAYNHEDVIAFTAGYFNNNSYAANYQIEEQHRFGFLNEANGQPGDFDSDGVIEAGEGDWVLVPDAYNAASNFMEREREGGSFSLEAKPNERLTLRADIFYTSMDQYD